MTTRKRTKTVVVTYEGTYTHNCSLTSCKVHTTSKPLVLKKVGSKSLTTFDQILSLKMYDFCASLHFDFFNLFNLSELSLI